MRKYGFSNEHGSTFDFDIHFLEFPIFEYGQEIVNDIEIQGRYGTLTEHTDTYEDTIITNVVEFDCENIFEYEKKAMSIRTWLKKTRKLVYSDREDMYFIVKKVEISEDTRSYGIYGNMQVVFTCHPAVFFSDGDYDTELKSGVSIYNAYSKSKPVYVITGEGVCTISVNGRSIIANVGQNLTIDTELMIAYRTDGTMMNTSITGKYCNLYLDPGANKIIFSPGFLVKIIPKWRVMQ